jgi:hypothetical protein
MTKNQCKAKPPATIEQRITAPEQKKFRNPDLAIWTDEELLDFLGLPEGATDDELVAIALGGSLWEATWE